jgi:LysR family transcriptional regulator, glycine cleavage system transcriptional activator
LASRIPPLNPLRAFEAAARHLSFSKAAEELLVTQGAISRSVRVLENYLKRPLFDRRPGGLVLTPGSGEYATALTESFARIEDASADFLKLTTESMLSVRAYTSFLMHWLIPRLPLFQRRQPAIEVQLTAATDRVPFSWNGVDVRIRYGKGRWPDSESILLFADEVTPVCSPALARQIAKRGGSLAEQTLLSSRLRRRDWGDWLKIADQSGNPIKEISYQELSVTYHAAIAGQGVALAQRAYMQDLIAGGQLVEVSDIVLRRDEGYYLTYKSGRQGVKKISVFRDWIVSTLDEGNVTRT